MNNISALSSNTVTAQGREGPGIWEQAEGFMDFMQALLSQGDSPESVPDPVRMPSNVSGMWYAALAGTNTNANDMEVTTVGTPPVANGQEDLLQLIALLTGEEDNDDFLCALMQYVKGKPEFEETVNAADTSESILEKLDLLIKLLKPEPGEEQPPELAPLFLLLASLSPAPQEQIIQAEQGEQAVDATGEIPETGEVPETGEAAVQQMPEPPSAPVETAQNTFDAGRPEPSAQFEKLEEPPELPSRPEPSRSSIPWDSPPENVRIPVNQPAVQDTNEPAITAAAQPEHTVPPEQTAAAAQPSAPQEIPARRESQEIQLDAMTEEINIKVTAEASSVSKNQTAAQTDIAAEETVTQSNPETRPAPGRYAKISSRAVFASLYPTARFPRAASTPSDTAPAAETATVQPVTEDLPELRQTVESVPAAEMKTQTEDGQETVVEEPGLAETKKAGSGQPEDRAVGNLTAAEPVQQAGETQEPPPVKQVLAEKIIEQIAQKTAQQPNATVLQMELHPKFLGKIQITLEATAEGITAKIKSENGSVRALLGEHLEELKTSLREAGVNMRDIEVTESRIGTNLSQSFNRQEQQAQMFRNGGGKTEKILRAPPVAAQQEIAETLADTYTMGRVSGLSNDTMFDYRA